jgi:hypothetical protein
MKYDRDSLSDQIHLGAAYAKAGAREQAETILKPVKMSGEYVSPVELVMFYVASGEREKAFSSLECVSDAHDL